jgi:capsular exopolysaccharide synthesis family protein
LLRNRLDEVVRDESTVQESLGGLPLLSRVPRWKSRGQGGLITLTQPDSPSSQAFKALGARLRVMLDRRRRSQAGRGPVVLCTSSEPSEGKTALAANLAVASARVGERVVLVDADLRRDGRERIPGMPPRTPGLSDLLVNEDLPAEYLVPGPIENLRFLPSGATRVDPNELMASARMASIVESLSDIADLVILDTAPTLPYADSLEMANVADLALLVTQLGKSRISAVEVAAERLLQVSADSSVGAVLLDGTSRAGRGRSFSSSTPKRTRGAETVQGATSSRR